jgi:hypothetical protein
MLTGWQRLRLTGPGDERLGQQQLRVAAPSGLGLCRGCQLGHRELRSIQAPCTKPVASASTADQDLLRSPRRPLSSRATHRAGRRRPALTSVLSSSSAAWAPPAAPAPRRDRRFQIRARVVDVAPEPIQSAHANFEGGRTEPMSTATTQTPVPSDQHSPIRAPQPDHRRQAPPAAEADECPAR